MRAKREHNVKNKKQEKVNKKAEDDREMDTETHAHRKKNKTTVID